MPRRTGHCILDEFQTHPPEAQTRQTASRRSGAPCSKRDEFLKRDRQLSLRTPIPGSAPSLRPEFNPATEVPQGPRRPRLSFFRCNCQTARSRSSTDKNKTLGRPAAKAQFRPEFRVTTLARSPKRPKILRPRLAAGRSAFGKFP